MRSAGGPENGAPVDLGEWAGPDGALGRYIVETSRKTLKAYEAQPDNVPQDASQEIGTAGGGYADRQIVELIQNSADALDGPMAGERGRISIQLTGNYLYCADDGDEMDEDGARALLFSHLSPKRRESEIGRFGLGFKAVLRVSDAPEFYSRSGSFRFDRRRTAERIREVVPDAEIYPALRLADPVDPSTAGAADRVLADLMTWARNIVRLPLVDDAHDRLARQIHEFPHPFLLFVDHVRRLTLDTGEEGASVDLEVERDGDKCRLRVDDEEQTWMVFRRSHRLSRKASADWSHAKERETVPLWWAYPQNRSQSEMPRHFWAYFPTATTSRVPGILNAPWKTNEDRQNLLPGDFNEELIEVAANLIVDELAGLATADDPAAHLDALPRRKEADETRQSRLLRDRLLARLRRLPIVPDQDGVLRVADRVRYPPKEATPEAIERWAACGVRPADWVHPTGARRERLARVEQLWSFRRKPREWLEALFDEASTPADLVEASRTAVQVAALLPRAAAFALGEIVLTATGARAEVDPKVLLLPAPGEPVSPDLSGDFVHPELVGDEATRTALGKLGFRARTHAALRVALARLTRWPGEDDAPFDAFWASAREVTRTHGIAPVESLLRESRDALSRERLQVRVESGRFRPVDSVLLPGPIVESDAVEDADAVVDMVYHREDRPLLELLGVVDRPGFRELGDEPFCQDYRQECKHDFVSSCEEQNLSKPHQRRLRFDTTKGIGPLQVLGELGEKARMRYTVALLEREETYAPWTMRHETRDGWYPAMPFEAPALRLIRQEGRLPAGSGGAPFADALGTPPRNREALRYLLEHAMVGRIRREFDLADLGPEFHGQAQPELLLECWPGLSRLISREWKDCRLRRCERIEGASNTKCVLHDGDIYLVSSGDEVEDLGRVVESLGEYLSSERLRRVVHRIPQEEVERLREEVRAHGSNEERLIAAVGVDALRKLLPESLVSFLEAGNQKLSPPVVAEAAISVCHTETLRRCRDRLGRLDPPRKWAGSGPAVAFVKSLGFPAEWAGERNRKGEPYLEVQGRFRLPRLHGYQKGIVHNVHAMLLEGKTNPDARRGMISLPTGSGKTRVAVQAAVAALARNDLGGGVLWVADRGELCEQAVEAWRQVWSAKGVPGTVLRISRLWGGQPAPSRTSDLHVVVASIQTLLRRIEHYPFLKEFRLVVFDEAHRSLARSFTSVMATLGLRHPKEVDEPYLLGLTATPYRGYNKEETERLANRYGPSRLDWGVFPDDDPESAVKFLQRNEVLAEADHETIEGVALEMTPEEERDLEALPSWLPDGLEKRIGRDSERTERIVDAFVSRRETAGPTLIFATSVEHADTVSAILNMRDIRARAVNGNTNPGTRRRIVEEFRAGEVEVLVNYGVFREGFDAPKTRTIIVARPVYSPNLYFQMIGRGLRGVKNGGNPRCLILNVEDNILNFDRKLAFSELDWLWAAGA